MDRSDEDSDGGFRGKRYVVFGAGYVGGALARLLQSEGAIVETLTRNRATADCLRAQGFPTVVADLAGDEWHGETAAESYAAAINTVSAAAPSLDGYRESYIAGMQSIARWSRARTIGRFIYTGSSGVYAADGGIEVDESGDVGGSERAGILAAAEELALRCVSTVEGTAVLRLVGIYGPGRHYLLDQIRKGQRILPGAGDHHLNLIHRDDAVGAIRAALSVSPDCLNTVYNIADNEPATKREVVAFLAERLNRGPITFDPAAGSGRPGRGPIPDRIVVNRKARRVLQWAPRFNSFREGYEAILSGHSG